MRRFLTWPSDYQPVHAIKPPIQETTHIYETTSIHETATPIHETTPSHEITPGYEITLSHDIESEDGSNPPKTNWPGPWGRIGVLAGTTILFGTMLQLATFGFLIFLWAGRGANPSGADAPSLWRYIFLRGAGTRVVTVCALIVRSTVGFQATVCTGLAAALALEARDVVDMNNAATFSILRAVNGGPISFVFPLVRTPRRLVTSVPVVLILTLWLGSMAISFSSTILLSDFHSTPLVLDSSTTHVPVIEATAELVSPFRLADTNIQNKFDPGIWQQPLQTFPSFGEATLEAPVVRDGSTDTGLIKRSLIPLQAQSRKNLRSYRGDTAAYTSRVSCARPTITGKIYAGMSRILGNVTWESQDAHSFLDGLSCGPPGSTCPPIPFDCVLPYTPYTKSDQPILPRLPTSLCIIQPFTPKGRERYLPHYHSPVLMLVFESLIDTDNYNEYGFRNVIPLPKQSNSLEWAVLDLGASRKLTLHGDSIILNATVCLFNSTLKLERASLSTTADPPELEMQYNASTRSWSTDSIVNMVDGTSNLPYAARGIMALDTSEDISPDELDRMYAGSLHFDPGNINSSEVTRQFFSQVNRGIITSEFHRAYQPTMHNFSIFICGVCATNHVGLWFQAHPYVSVVFHAVVDRTASIAQALHAAFFWLYQEQYSNAIPGFDMGENSTMIWSSEALVPVGRTGIIIVGALVLINLACVFAVTGLFLWKTQWSLYGNVWHAVAQLVAGPEMRPILEAATKATDQEVKGKLRNEGISSVNVGLWDQEDGKLAVASGSDHSTSV